MTLRLSALLIVTAILATRCAPVATTTDAACPDAFPRGECDHRGQQCGYGQPELGGNSAVCTCTADPIGSPDHLGSSWSCESRPGF